MKFNSQNYLDCYTKLHSPQSSKQANKILLQIEQSDDAWKIAEELMLQENYNIHGSQLLSKKLNSSLPSQVNPEVLAQFILSMKQVSNIHWLCLAKLFVHTHQTVQELKIEGPLGIDVKLNILKEIPYALGQMKIQFGIKNFHYKTEVFKQNKFLILESIKFCYQHKESSAKQIENLKDLILETLQSFTQHRVTLNSPEIAEFILSLSDSDKSSTLLEYIFLEEKYPELEDEFERFLDNNIHSKQKDWIKTFYLNYYAKKNIFETSSVQKYEQVLRNATMMMRTESQEDFRTILMDSFQFWIGLINKLSKEGNGKEELVENKQKEKLLKQSLFIVFQELCKHSRLKKCPSNIKVVESNLDIIDLDSEEVITESSVRNNLNDEYSEINYNAFQIRDLSIDLLVKIEEGLQKDSELYRKMFELLFLLTSNQQDLQNLELVIFIVDGMTDYCDQQSKPYLSELIKIILGQKDRLNEYICQRIIIMLGKIDKIIVSNLSMLPLVFDFFSNTIMYDKLSCLASQSFTDLMDQYEVKNLSVDAQFKQKSQSFLNFWFQTFYQKITNQRVLQNITKALVIFIYKFKGPQYYQKFLLMMKGRIDSSTEQCLKDIYLQAVVTGQSWINSREQNQTEEYLVVFANFMNEFLKLLLTNCFKVNRKPQFTKAISKINWALKAGSYFTDIDRWLEAIKQIINKALFQSPTEILTVALTPIITLLKDDKITHGHLKSLILCLRQILDSITQLFIKFHQNKTTLDYNFSKYVIQIHNLLISILLKNPELSQSNLISYDPTLLLEFIKQRIFKNKTFWEYQVYRETLIFMNELVLSDFQIQIICEEVLRICGRTLQSLWIQTENIFFNIYKKLGLSPFLNSLEKIKPEILAPNPLFTILQEGLQKSDRKMLKSFVRCL